ncbi:LysR family transcriptional regulator [Actinomadura sp. WAC 06369]|uniref:LysR family transcriptional regulator n=1 Tax=Actinomadura sp. WAC 06369 TaxID=2203193 RepID=UPI000F7AE848|nr:LysR family transcriptional regulator [Actinomadura sp. WAC 06369]RSN45375.1 LysR family transcriptional regulator [Actinomadura sp. WAC 06369]
MLDLHRLRLLRELKHRGTLAAVAEALAYSPSTVSQQLSVLEREAGVRLLEPVGRRVRLTPQAEILVAHTEAVLERLERAEADLAASLEGLTGTLRVAAFQTAALALVPDALGRLGAAHPRLRVEVTQCEPESALPALLARDFDVAVTEEYPDEPIPRPDGIEYAELGRDEMRLALPAGSAAGGIDGEAAPAAAAGLPWVMEPAGTASRRWATRLCRDAGFEPDVRYESTDLLLHLRLVERGHAAALLPDLVWTGAAPAVPVARLPRGRHVRRLFAATRRGSGAHPAVRAWCEALARPLRERPPHEHPQSTLKGFASGG